MTTRRSLLAGAVLLLVVSTPIAIRAAAAPSVLSYEGRLLRSDGSPESGTVNLIFRLYEEATGGDDAWSETLVVALAAGGYYAVYLGRPANPLPPFDGRDYWLGLTVLNEPEMTPRTQLASVAYALRATSAERADQADRLEGHAATEFLTPASSLDASKLLSGVVPAGRLPNAPSWDTAYSERRQWDGGTTGLVAAAGRASLGLTGVANWDQAYAERRQWDGGTSGLNPITARASLGLGPLAVSASVSGGNSGTIDDNSITDDDLFQGSFPKIQGIGTLSSLRIVDGNQDLGRVLTSDSSGNASWQPGGSGGATFVSEASDLGPGACMILNHNLNTYRVVHEAWVSDTGIEWTPRGSARTGNLALGSLATALNGTSPSLVNDGVIEGPYPCSGSPNRWISASIPAWWQVDLGQTYTIEKTRVLAGNCGDHFDAWEVQFSVDGTNFQTAASGACTYDTNNLTATCDSFVDHLVSGLARYVRINGTSPQQSNTYGALMEVEVYGEAAIESTVTLISPTAIKLCNLSSATRKFILVVGR